jgi:DNA-binding NarL/FixJ family response regulator
VGFLLFVFLDYLRRFPMDVSAQDERSLLLIEESSAILDSLRDWLRMTLPNVRVIEATDHGNGVSLNRSESPDVVLVDISGLGREGLESVRTMKRAQPAAQVFALVGHDHESYHEAVVSAGAEACACIWRLRTDLLPRLRNAFKSTAEMDRMSTR